MLPFTISEAISETVSERLTVGTGILAIEPTVTLDKEEGLTDVLSLIFTILTSNRGLCFT
jgi:hypothetical protein